MIVTYLSNCPELYIFVDPHILTAQEGKFILTAVISHFDKRKVHISWFNCGFHILIGRSDSLIPKICKKLFLIA